MIGILAIVLVCFLFSLCSFRNWRVRNGLEGLEFWEFGLCIFVKAVG